MAPAAVGGLSGTVEEQLRGLRQYRRASRRSGDGCVLPRALRQEVPVGPSRYRRHRVEEREGKRGDGTSGAAAHPVPHQPRQEKVTRFSFLVVGETMKDE